jgi:hypothetical protein
MRNPTEQQIDHFILEQVVIASNKHLPTLFHGEATLRDGTAVYTAQYLSSDTALIKLKDLVAEHLEKQP